MGAKGRNIRGISNLDEYHYRHMIARGEVTDVSAEAVYGEFLSSGATTHHIIQPTVIGSGLNILPATGVTISIASTSDEDGAGTLTGILSVDIHYLDANLKAQRETKSLNGSGTVTTSATDIRHINCVHLVTAGSTRAAVGTITFKYSGTTYAAIEPLQTRCTSSVRRVPAGKSFIITDAWAGTVSGSGNVDAVVRFGGSFVESYHDFTEDGIFIPFMGIGLQNSATTLAMGLPVRIPSGYIVAMDCDTGGSNCQVVAGYAGYYEDE